MPSAATDRALARPLADETSSLDLAPESHYHVDRDVTGREAVALSSAAAPGRG